MLVQFSTCVITPVKCNFPLLTLQWLLLCQSINYQQQSLPMCDTAEGHNWNYCFKLTKKPLMVYWQTAAVNRWHHLMRPSYDTGCCVCGTHISNWPCSNLLLYLIKGVSVWSFYTFKPVKRCKCIIGCLPCDKLWQLWAPPFLSPSSSAVNGLSSEDCWVIVPAMEQIALSCGTPGAWHGVTPL